MNWSLEELSQRVQAALAAADVGPLNGQIAEVPNARTIRYYTTIGLLDRPKIVGRTATYGHKHLEQLVAIKRLQAKGLPLQQVQQELMALDDAALSRLAAVADSDAVHGPLPKTETRRERSFWSDDAAEPSAPEPVLEPQAVEPAPVRVATTLRPLTGVQVPGGVTLAFPAARSVDENDLEALRAALESVTKVLRDRGLLATESEGEQS